MKKAFCFLIASLISALPLICMAQDAVPLPKQMAELIVPEHVFAGQETTIHVISKSTTIEQGLLRIIYNNESVNASEESLSLPGMDESQSVAVKWTPLVSGSVLILYQARATYGKYPIFLHRNLYCVSQDVSPQVLIYMIASIVMLLAALALGIILLIRNKKTRP